MSSETTVMVVEDDPVSRDIVTGLLTRRGYAVVIAEDGAQALKLISPEIGVVVLDWMMPELDGLEVCRRLKSDSLPGYRYVIMITAKTEKADIVKALEAGADDYMRKPVDHDELLARIRAGERIVRMERSLLDAYEVARDEAHRDQLTGLFNRRYFDQALAQAVRRARRQCTSVALLMMDLDRFKDVNDMHGHMVGDEVLRQVAKVVAEEAREGKDIPARYGGEEFAVIAPDTNVVGAESLAERIRAQVARLRVAAGEALVSVTLSIGVAAFHGRVAGATDPSRALIEAADQRLYQAKHAGRNRVAA